jgi:membrane protein
MEDLRKVSSMQLYLFWKNLSIGLLTIIAMFSFSKLLPFYLSPVVSLISAAVLYTLLYNNKLKHQSSCMIVPYAIFFCLIAYTFFTILINVLAAWGLIKLPPEIIFFNNPYIPSLVMNPICFVTLLIIYFRRHNLRLCVNCKLHNGDSYERGNLGAILSKESHFQLKNLIIMFGILSAMIWAYYLLVYININVSARDWYVFTWLTIIAFVIDEVYFLFRYYNLYLDLKERNEIITPQELADMTAKTYLRFYVICGNSLYVNPHTLDPKAPYREVIDTPFFTKRSVNGITLTEVRRIIERMTGLEGELRFFYGRKSPDMSKHSLLRYFYFLDGPTCEYNDIPVDGEWMDFERIKQIYSNNPSRLSPISVADITRLATIVLTEKIFDSRGMRKSKIKTYNPSFSLEDVRHSELDFQDDKWIRISMFNSDTRLYRIKRWWRGISGKSNNRNQWR